MDRKLYRLAALDMDGTLLNSRHETTPYTRRAIGRAADAGGIVALCTGRSMSELWDHLRVNPGISYAICESGACVYDVRADRALDQLAMTQDVTRRLLDAARDFDVCVQCFVGNQSYMQIGDIEQLRPYHIYDFASVFVSGSEFVRDIRSALRGTGGAEKINLYFTDEVSKLDYMDRIGGEDVFLADSLAHGVELSPRGTTKARGLAVLCDHLGIPLSQTMAVGDGGNDLELMKAAGFSVAMANATDAVRLAADATTEDCDHDGAAKAVLRWMLGESPESVSKTPEAHFRRLPGF